MPTVPTLNGPSVAQTGQPTPTFRARAPNNPAPQQMEAVGRGLQAVGQAMDDEFVYQAQVENEARVTEFTNAAVLAKRRLLSGPDGGFLHRKGKAAIDEVDGQPVSAQYMQQFRGELEGLSRGLTNEAQRQAAQQVMREIAVEFEADLMTHAGRERTAYAIEQLDSTQQLAVNEAFNAWGDPKTVQRSVGAVRAAVAQKAELAGWSPEAAEIEQMKALTTLHAAVVTNAINAGQNTRARQYLKAAQEKGELTPSAATKLNAALEAGELKVFGQETADNLWIKHGGDVAAARREVRETLEGDREDEVLARLKVLHAEAAVGEADRRDALVDQAWTEYAERGTVSPSVMALLGGKDQLALRDRAAKDAEARAAGAERETVVEKWLEFTNIPPRQMAQMRVADLLAYKAYFSDADLRKADEMIRAARDEPKGKGAALFTKEMLLKRSAVSLGILPESGPGSKDEQQAYWDYVTELQTDIDAFEATTGQTAGLDDLDRIIREKQADVVRTGGWFGGKEQPSFLVDDMDEAYVEVQSATRRGGRTASGTERVRVAQVPASYRGNAIARLRAAGEPVTEQSIAQLWVLDGKPR